MSQTGSDSRKQYFRSLADLNDSPEFGEFLQREFPQAASEFPDGVSRRRWLQLMGASLALGGVSGCRYNREEIASFVVRPEGRLPGVANYFATNFEWAGQVMNLVATNLDGRPIKLDGNPKHPLFANTDPNNFNDGKEGKFASAGSSTFAQSAVLSLYDPDRLGAIIDRRDGKDVKMTVERDLPDWTKLLEVATPEFKRVQEAGGKGLAIVFESTRSPSLARALSIVKKRLPNATLVEFEAFDSTARKAAMQAVGADGEVYFSVKNAQLIVDLDARLLCGHPNAVVHAREFAKGRDHKTGPMNRLYCVESQYSTTGSAADFRLALRPSAMEAFVAKLEAAIDSGSPAQAGGSTEYSDLEGKNKVLRAVEVIATDLLSHKGNSIVAVGSHYSAAVQQAVLRINAKLGNFDKSVLLLPNQNALSDLEVVSFAEFVGKTSDYSDAWILASNPVFAAESDLKAEESLGKIGNKVYLASYDDETAAICQWVVPVSHPLESWGDVRSQDGTYCVCQPQIEPLLGSKDAIELLGIMSGAYAVPTMTFVMETAASVVGKDLSEYAWKKILHDGFAADTAAKPLSANIKLEGSLADAEIDPTAADKSNIDVLLIPSEATYDGRLSNNAWLQELPQSITKLTWDNAAIVSHGTAEELGLEQNVKARITVDGESIELPVFIVPGHAEGAITVAVGYGRTKAGSVGTGVGQNVNAFRTRARGSIITGASVSGTGTPYKLATTQDHFAIDEFGLEMVATRSDKLIREGTLTDFSKDEHFTEHHSHHPNESMWDEPIDKIEREMPFLPQWGMTIDLNKCIGCNSCVVACQAENNIPVVGKDQISRSREMHWLRIDRYFRVDVDKSREAGTFKKFVDVTIVNQPLACAHCETAPCEQVCPVAATVHTEEGINSMAYNRCIGTRYCGNNCPYKVRRFNYYNYNTDYGYYYGWSDLREEANKKLQSMVLNPDVSVRGRGVMEKCTYCIQRIQNGKIKARQVGDGKIQDGDVKTACQEACPSQAIQFGDLTDKNSRVFKLQNDPRAYAMLEDLNIKPRTLYLSRIRNVPERLMSRVQLHPAPKEAHGHGHDEGGNHEAGEHADTHDDEKHTNETHTDEKHGEQPAEHAESTTQS